MITFVGGVPGGATGRVVLISMRLIPLEKGRFVLRPSASSNAYVNDGLGTEAKVQLQEIAIQVEGQQVEIGHRFVGGLSSTLVIIVVGGVAVTIWHKKKSKKKR